MKTVIIDTINNNKKNNSLTMIVEDPNKLIRYNNAISFQHTKEINISEGKTIKLDSYVDNIRRKIYLHKLINKGSFNDVFSFSYKKYHSYDRNYIIRISNSTSSLENIKTELKGIKKQYTLCNKNEFIGQVIDFGQIFNPTKIIDYRLQEYSIHRKYGISLSKVLSKCPKYKNFNVVLQFIKNLLLAIDSIHQSGLAHLDLKPDNILLKNRFTYGNGIFDNLDFVIVDFGAARKFSTDKSKVLNEQMASAAFSPPELLKRKYGKKSDIWAYGVICYLVCIRKAFLKAKAQEIFMGKCLDTISENINISINNLLNNSIPKYLKTTTIKNKYMKPLKKSNFHYLKNYFKKIFYTDINLRPNSIQLLNSKLYNII